MKKLLLVLGLTLCLMGCSSAPPPSFRYYLIEPAGPQKTGEGFFIPLSLKVQTFSSQGCFGEKRIVCRKDPSRVEFYHYHFWAVPPGRMVAEAFASWLRNAGTFQDVLSPFQGGTGDLLLRGEIEALEEVDEGEKWFGRIVLQLRLESRRGEIIWKGRLERKIEAEKRTLDDVVACLNRAMAEILEEFLQVLAGIPPGSFRRPA